METFFDEIVGLEELDDFSLGSSGSIGTGMADLNDLAASFQEWADAGYELPEDEDLVFQPSETSDDHFGQRIASLEASARLAEFDTVAEVVEMQPPPGPSTLSIVRPSAHDLLPPEFQLRKRGAKPRPKVVSSQPQSFTDLLNSDDAIPEQQVAKKKGRPFGSGDRVPRNKENCAGGVVGRSFAEVIVLSWIAPEDFQKLTLLSCSFYPYCVPFVSPVSPSTSKLESITMCKPRHSNQQKSRTLCSSFAAM